MVTTVTMALTPYLCCREKPLGHALRLKLVDPPSPTCLCLSVLRGRGGLLQGHREELEVGQLLFDMQMLIIW